jgi:uncharacterized repeat protein (TIGR01451 family)
MLCCNFNLSAQDTKTSVSNTQNGVFLQKVVSNTAVQSGVGFTYTIFYSIPAGRTGVTITDNVPASLVIDNVIASPVCGTPSVSTVGNTVTYQLASVPTACSGSFQINVHFREGTTCHNATAENGVCIVIRSPAMEMCTKTVRTTAQAVNPWHVYQTPVNVPYMGGSCPYATASDTVEYDIRISKIPGIYGMMNLNVPQVVAQVPSGATLISSSIGAPGIGTITQSGAGSNIIWSGLGTLDATQQYFTRTARIKIKYLGIVPPTNISNTVVLTGTLGSVTQSCGIATESNTTCIQIAVAHAPDGRFYKTANVSGNSVGCLGFYYLYVNNIGTAPLSNFDVVDAIPTGITVNTITVYGTPLNPVVLWINGAVLGTYSSTATVNVSSVSNIRFQNTGQLAINAWAYHRIDFTINASAPNTVTNTASLQYGPAPQTVVSASAAFGVFPPAPKPCIYKEICEKKTTYSQGSTIRYRLRVQNVGSSSMTGAKIIDALDPNLEYAGNERYYTANSYNVPCGGANQTAWTGIVQSHSTASNYLSWTLPTIGSNCESVFYPNCGFYGTSGLLYHFIEFDVKVRDTAYVGVVPNLFSIKGNGFTTINSNVEYLTINANWAFSVDKKVSKDNGATFASSVLAAPNSSVQYRLTMKSTASAIKNLTMIDMLPKSAGANDFFMLVRVNRGSPYDIKYTNFLASTLPVTTSFENNASNICLPELGFSPTGCSPSLWAGSAPSLNAKMSFGSAWLPTGASEIYDFKANVSPTAQVGEIGCNTFAANAAAPMYIDGVAFNQIMSPLESGTACIKIIDAPNCCERTKITPILDPCCSQLQIDRECAVRSIKVDLNGGTFTDLNWSCGPIPVDVVGLQSIVLSASATCGGAVVNPCFQATGTGSVNITYTITFADGSTCVKSEIKRCCCAPKVSVPVSGCNGVATIFEVDTINCKIKNPSWEFGDGTTSNIANTTHTYNNTGIYTATFRYMNECGEFKISYEINIEQCPCEVRPCFEYRSSELTARFGSTSISNYPIVAYHWDFGDGTWANGPNPSHTYARSGEYEVCMTVYVDNGFGLCECTSKVCMIVTVREGGRYGGTTCPTRIRSNSPAGSSSGNASESLKMRVFPNPSSSNLTVVFDKKGVYTEGSPSQLEIYNLQGQLIKKQAVEGNLDETKVSLQQLQTGTYILSLRQNGQVVSSVKVTKN